MLSSSAQLTRRDVLKGAGASALASALPARAQTAAPDYRLEIAPCTLEVAPRTWVRTTAYNGGSPGPLLRLREGEPVTVEVTNRTDRPEVAHWHGLFLPPLIDGALEEGTPPIPPGATTRLTFEPRPAGFRWYHSHIMAMSDLTRGLYSAQHGPLLIEPRENPARFDREFFLTLQDWDARLAASDDGAMNPVYGISSINGRALHHGEPLRVQRGERVLLHFLNASASEVHWIALAGHALQVIALDGNALGRPVTVPMLRLAPAERVCALVEMSNPGVWILGEVRRHLQAAGMGIVVEYAGSSASPQWDQPASLIWSYEQFSSAQEPAESAATGIPLVFAARFRGHGAMEAWTINGRSYPDCRVAPLVEGRRYRLQFINTSSDDHPLHLHRHSFALRSLRQPLDAHGNPSGPGVEVGGILKDVVLVEANTRVEVDFTADHPGATLLHCHQQSHMDLGFMMLLEYA